MKTLLRRCAAMREDRLARAAHVRRVDVVADHLQREIGLDACADVERAGVDERPAAVIALDPAQIDSDQALKLEVGRLAAEVPEQDIFGGNGRVGLEFEAPVAVLSLLGQQRLRGAGNVKLEGLRRLQVLGMI